MMQEEVKEHLKKMKRSGSILVLFSVALDVKTNKQTILQILLGLEARLRTPEARCRILAAEPQQRIHIRKKDNVIQIIKTAKVPKQNEPKFAWPIFS